MSRLSFLRQATIGGIVVLLFASCAQKDGQEPVSVRGGISGIESQRTITNGITPSPGKRGAALLGVFVSRFLAETMGNPVQSALIGIASQTALASPAPVTDPDFALMQSLGDALSIDLTDHLNRSIDRVQALDRYIIVLTELGDRATARLTELTTLAKNTDVLVRDQRRVTTELRRSLDQALEKQDFQTAGTIQRQLIDQEKILTERELKLTQTEGVIDTFTKLVELFGERLLAIQKNREALITGTKVIDVPGVTELNILEQDPTAPRRRVAPRRSNGLFDFSRFFQGL